MHGRLNLAGVLAVIGAIVLLVGLSLDWYEPGISAWTVFEIIDLALAAIAVGVVVVALARSPQRPRLEAAMAWLPIAAITALVLVVAALINPPPAAIDRAMEIGVWVSLGGAILLVIAALLATTELSVVVTMRPRPSRRRPESVQGARAADEPAWDPPPDEPFDEPPIEDNPTDEAPLEAAEGELGEPIDERTFPAEDFEHEDETQPLPRRRPER